MGDASVFFQHSHSLILVSVVTGGLVGLNADFFALARQLLLCQDHETLRDHQEAAQCKSKKAFL